MNRPGLVFIGETDCFVIFAVQPGTVTEIFVAELVYGQWVESTLECTKESKPKLVVRPIARIIPPGQKQ